MGKKLFIFIISFCLLSYSHAQELDKKQIKLIERVLTVSGVKKQLEGIGDMVKEQVTKSQDKLGPEAYAKINQSITQAYDADILYADILEYFKTHFNEERLSAIVEWYKSPTAKKITKLEIEASSPEGKEEMRKFAQQMALKPPRRETVTLIQRLDEVTNGSGLTLAVYTTTTRELLKAMNSVAPPDKQATEAKLEEIMSNIKKNVQPTLKYATLVDFLYTYRNLSEEELNKYISFYRTDSGEWLVTNLNDALLNAVANAAKKIGKEIAAVALEKRVKMEAALNQEGLSYDEIDPFISKYYLHPQSDKLIKVLRFFLSQDLILNDHTHFDPLEHFFATVANRDSAVLESIKSLKTQYSDKQREALNKIIDQAENFKSPEPTSARNLDFLWSEFMANGREETIKKIIGTLEYPAVGDNLLIIGAAKWSLASNANKHQRVYEIIQKESVSATGKLKKELEGIMEKSKSLGNLNNS